MPIGSLTPGAKNPAVNQSDIRMTICKSGWTSTIRPTSSYTDRVKKEQLFGSYAADSDKVMGDYEEDHLISLELGGGPTSVANLWPEPYAGALGVRVKDRVETKLKTLVCTGKVTLRAAQEAIATDWYGAYQRYVLGINTPLTVVTTPTPTSTLIPADTAMPKPGGTATATATATHPAGATALCKDGTYSYSLHHSGFCSGHGGVAVFYI